MGQVKVLIVGSWFSTTYENPLFEAFKTICTVDKFTYCTYFSFTPLSNELETGGSFVSSCWQKFQYKYIIGPSVRNLNNALIKKVEEFKPDLIFLYRPTHIWPSTVKSIREKAKVFVYNNDDPFTEKLPKYVYRYFFSILKFADKIYAYREKNIKEYASIGFKNTSLLLPNYRKDKHYPIPKIKKNVNVVFIGHFEKDGRDNCLRSLIEKFGKGIEIWGNNWENSPHYSFFKSYLGRDICPLFDDDYNKKLNESKIALVFLSKINNDKYTRRCFEIPATRTLMLCEYTKEMALLFKEDIEAVYFRSRKEILDKVGLYLSLDSDLKRIQNEGYSRLLSDGHEVLDRAIQIISDYEDMNT
ncbi:MAG: glycosyltransferase [Bacteriovoracaceae bacterium]|nr:glycosyltransferase [Bacteriovoracaceae bacterium]